ncbi:hypothetical protein BV25DRAFT_1450583 [Artomyces pyxidatus]|uniref:Uncharacterized protein n=1 Tax=Artomyces pyxidatus TaxID=48021 RepID=A0ACB8SMC9_9AGAM|nr:hypothetical protein BV25DRAFT_1450583 [Artomyces pyxidatus]
MKLKVESFVAYASKAFSPRCPTPDPIIGGKESSKAWLRRVRKTIGTRLQHECVEYEVTARLKQISGLPNFLSIVINVNEGARKE